MNFKRNGDLQIVAIISLHNERKRPKNFQEETEQRAFRTWVPTLGLPGTYPTEAGTGRGPGAWAAGQWSKQREVLVEPNFFSLRDEFCFCKLVPVNAIREGVTTHSAQSLGLRPGQESHVVKRAGGVEPGAAGGSGTSSPHWAGQALPCSS